MQVYDLRRLPEVKRDLDLIRELMLKIEENPQMDGTREFYLSSPSDLGIQNHSVEEVAYHLALLIRAGFVDGAVTLANPMQVVRRLTWEGHEFLDNVRSDTLWNKAKGHFASLPSVGLGVIAAYVQAEIKKHFGITS